MPKYEVRHSFAGVDAKTGESLWISQENPDAVARLDGAIITEAQAAGHVVVLADGEEPSPEVIEERLREQVRAADRIDAAVSPAVAAPGDRRSISRPASTLAPEA